MWFSLFSFYFLKDPRKISNSPLSIRRPCPSFTLSTQSKKLCIEAKDAKEKNKELSNKVLLKKGEVIRLTKDLNHLQGIEMRLKDDVKKLKANSIEKETFITHLEGKVLKLTSSLEKTREEAIAAFKRSDEFKNRLNSHYTASYEDFYVDAKETYLDMDFDSFKIPLATESSLLPTSSKDVNMVDDATTEIAQGVTAAGKDDSKSGGDAPSGLSQ